MRFKVGDKVKVIEDLSEVDVGWVHDMLEFAGKDTVVETLGVDFYHLSVDNHEWYWDDNLVEGIKEGSK